MRVLITTPAALGHIHPMVPLARALRDRRHEVLWAVPADGVDHVERAGIPAVISGPAGLTRLADIRARYREFDALAPDEVPNHLFGKTFGATVAPPMLAALLPVARDWSPDLVVADAAEFAGHIVAGELGIPSITKGFGPLLPQRRVAAAGQEVAPLWRSRGLDPRPYSGCYDCLYLDIYPPELDNRVASHVPRRQLLRPLADDGMLDTATPPPLPAGRSSAPLAYVTMGTVFNDDPAPFRLVLGALRELDVRVLVTIGPQADASALGAQPPHVRVEQYVPQARVLPHCDVVVSHAGSGTVLARLAAGLPQLCLPQGADQFLNAAATAAAGAALSLSPGEVTADAVRDAIARLLTDVAIRDAALSISASIASMPSPDAVAAMLETEFDVARAAARQGSAP